MPGKCDLTVDGTNSCTSQLTEPIVGVSDVTLLKAQDSLQVGLEISTLKLWRVDLSSTCMVLGIHSSGGFYSIDKIWWSLLVLSVTPITTAFSKMPSILSAWAWSFHNFSDLVIKSRKCGYLKHTLLSLVLSSSFMYSYALLMWYSYLIGRQKVFYLSDNDFWSFLLRPQTTTSWHFDPTFSSIAFTVFSIAPIPSPPPIHNHLQLFMQVWYFCCLSGHWHYQESFQHLQPQ